MNRKPNLWDRITDFISGKGFYLVLLVCLAAIGISGYFLVGSISETFESDPVAAVGSTQMPEESVAPAPSVSADAQTSRKPVVSVSPEPEDSPSPAVSAGSVASPSAAPSQEPAPQPSQEAEASKKPAALVFTRPVNGAVIASFSAETLVYDETMGDWRIHEGIDLAAALGTRVLAVAAGTVSEVYEDELMGTTVVIDHGDGLTSVYSNLHAQPPVEAGEKVYTGDVIGAVGDTALVESGREPHIHFAMYQDGAAVDPEEYLPDL